MFGLNSSGQPVYKLPYYIDNIEIIAMTAAIICSFPIFRGLLIGHGKRQVTVACVNVWLLSLFVLSISFLAAATYNPFIYFRFWKMVKRNNRMSTSCGKQWRSEFVTVPPCFSFCDVQLSGGNFLKPRAKVKNVVTALQFFRAAIVTQLMKHFATTMVHGLFRDELVL